ncbi:MAG: hypothetical protein IKB09_07120 [Oscillospiraceae bacterium]|nr:hypothetical protein [Oscillospiraceae bacterium]
MKKHDEGYVLPLVLVVMIVMCLIATSLMSFSLQNLKSQQSSIKRMADKYEAEGVVETVIAKIKVSDVNDIENVVNQLPKKPDKFNLNTSAEPYIVEIEVKTELVMVSCELEVTLDSDKKIASVTYKKYDISNTGGNAS